MKIVVKQKFWYAVGGTKVLQAQPGLMEIDEENGDTALKEGWAVRYTEKNLGAAPRNKALGGAPETRRFPDTTVEKRKRGRPRKRPIAKT